MDYITEDVKRGTRKGSWYSCPPYDFYVGVMAGYFNKGGPDRRDTIITFNYDTLFEDALNDLGITPDYALQYRADPLSPSEASTPAVQGAAILKLHGSVNWVAGSESWARSDENLGVSEHRELARRIEVKPYAELRTQGLPPLLLPPTWRKVAHPALSQVWDAAVVALRTATTIVILGYSVPSTDQHFRYLIAAGLQDNISLRKIFFVNPALADETQATVLKDRLFGSGGLFRPELQEQGIVELLPVDTREFFTGPHDIYGGEPYRVRIGRPVNPKSCTADDAPFRFSDRPENLGAWW